MSYLGEDAPPPMTRREARALREAQEAAAAAAAAQTSGSGLGGPSASYPIPSPLAPAPTFLSAGPALAEPSIQDTAPWMDSIPAPRVVPSPAPSFNAAPVAPPGFPPLNLAPEPSPSFSPAPFATAPAPAPFEADLRGASFELTPTAPVASAPVVSPLPPNALTPPSRRSQRVAETGAPTAPPVQEIASVPGPGSEDLDFFSPELPASRTRSAARKGKKVRAKARKEAGAVSEGSADASATAPLGAQKTIVVNAPPRRAFVVLKIVWWAISILLMVAGLGATWVYPGIVRHQGNETAAILSGSMEPTYKVRDQILINKTFDAQQLKVGDVITFAVRGETVPVTHRIIAVTPPDPSVQGSTLTFATKGDNNATADPDPVAPVNVIGVVEKDLGVWGRFMTFVGYGWPWLGDSDGDTGTTHWWETRWFALGVVFGPAALSFLLPEVYEGLIQDTRFSPAHRRRMKAIEEARKAGATVV